MRRRFATVSRDISISAVVYRGPDECEEIEVEVSGSVTPYSRGTRDDPPEGGEVEDLIATFHDGTKAGREIPLTPDEIAAFEEQIAIEADDRD